MVESKNPTIFSIMWSQADYNATKSVNIVWKLNDTLCQDSTVNESRNVTVDITAVPHTITGLKVYSRYNITACVEDIMVCHSLTDTTAPLGKV